MLERLQPRIAHLPNDIDELELGNSDIMLDKRREGWIALNARDPAGTLAGDGRDLDKGLAESHELRKAVMMAFEDFERPRCRAERLRRGLEQGREIIRHQLPNDPELDGRTPATRAGQVPPARQAHVMPAIGIDLGRDAAETHWHCLGLETKVHRTGSFRRFAQATRGRFRQ